jgi:polysaccharide pyruvyl transferase WcaK-like protein
LVTTDARPCRRRLIVHRSPIGSPVTIARMRILVEPSAHGMVNIGDIAMLAVAVGRLRELWPEASIGVITDAPDRLAIHCPDTTPIPAAGRRLWLEEPYVGAAIHRRLPRLAGGRLHAGEQAVRRRWPALAASVIRLRRRVKRQGSEELSEFLDWVFGADLVVVSGAGLLADPYAPRACTVLELLETANKRGVPTAMLGQGVGPVTDEKLRSTGRRVLPKVDLIGLREERAGRPILRALGVSDERMMTTGDDAIEVARDAGVRREDRRAIGVNVRVARYAGVEEEMVNSIGRALTSAGAERGSELLGIPISRYAKEQDAATIDRMLGAERQAAGPPGSVYETIERIGRCRVVVAGSYHAGVFAMTQGIPTVGLVASQYYADKFQGLADQFGGSGCTLVALDKPNLELRLEEAIDEAWRAAPGLADALREAAQRQVAQGRSAYGRLRSISFARGRT